MEGTALSAHEALKLVSAMAKAKLGAKPMNTTTTRKIAIPE